MLVKMGNLQLSPGSLFANRLEIERTAGSGGMGTIYRAIDRYSGDTVALKLLHSGGGSAEAERFLREAQLLAEILMTPHSLGELRAFRLSIFRP